MSSTKSWAARNRPWLSFPFPHGSARQRIALVLLVLLLALPFASLPLIARDREGPADLILVIGGDHKPERIARAAQLYRDGYAPLVLLSAGTPVQEGNEVLPEAQVMLRQAQQAGIPPSAVLLEQASQTTVENAVESEHILRERGINSILLITSAYQSQRARRIFTDHFGASIQVSVQPSLGESFCALCWLAQADQVPVVLSEYWKWLIYLVFQR